MPSLAELQAAVRAAVTAGDANARMPVLIGGARAASRLQIHQRHYEASLVGALLEKFPATAWLAGSGPVTDAARRFVRAHPPTRPCIAEYGAEFPAFLRDGLGEAAPPYLSPFAELEWHVGQVSIAVDHPALDWPAVAGIGAERLLDGTLVLQPGLRFMKAVWALDELLTVYLSGSAPDHFTLAEGDRHLQVRGARGDVRFARLDRGDWTFRAALAGGATVGEAAERALERSADFDPAARLVAAVSEGLVTGVRPGPRTTAT